MEIRAGETQGHPRADDGPAAHRRRGIGLGFTRRIPRQLIRRGKTNKAASREGGGLGHSLNNAACPGGEPSVRSTDTAQDRYLLQSTIMIRLGRHQGGEQSKDYYGF